MGGGDPNHTPLASPNPEENPIICSPYAKPDRHWKLNDRGRATTQLIEGRRPSSAFIHPVPDVHAKIKHDPTRDQINAIRNIVDQWRSSGWEGATLITRQLLEHWTHTEHIPRLYWAQIEALETIIWLHEIAPHFPKYAQVLNNLKQSNHDHNDDLFRIALKMATGTGKTLVMAMIIAWQVCNSKEASLSYASQFIVVTPGLIIRDRLEELRPNTHNNIYEKMNLIPFGLHSYINSSSVCIVNYQSFRTRDLYTSIGATGREKRLLGVRSSKYSHETETIMLQRVLDGLSLGKNVVVINDEAHHCYKPGTGKKRGENKEDSNRAAVWFRAMNLIKNKFTDLLYIYDLSATPKFIERGENRLDSLFPWTVSDFPITDAIESGLVKIPRVPVSETGLNPSECRNVYENTDHEIRKKLNPDYMPDTITDPLNSLYSKYKTKFNTRKNYHDVPPVFIIVADSINNAKALYDYVAGRYVQKENNGQTKEVWVDGKFSLFSNNPETNTKLNTIMVHSRIDEDDSFDEMKDIIRDEAARLGKATSHKTDLEIVRDVLATVGKKNTPGENIRCVVSVSMLSEGWDAKNVTHIFGFRKFGTQLICEQISGRALRREDDVAMPTWYEHPEFAEIYGVPFNYMVDSKNDPPPGPSPERVSVFPKDNSDNLIIEFPIVDDYLRRVLPNTTVTLDPSKITKYEIDSPPREELQGIVGQSSAISSPISHIQEAKFRLTHAIMKNWLTLEQHSTDESVRTYNTLNLFSQMRQNLDAWLSSPLVKRSKNFEPFWLWTNPHKSQIPHEVIRACSITTMGQTMPIQAIFSPYSPGSTNNVKFETAVPKDHIYESPRKSQHNCVPCHSKLEVNMAKILDRLDIVMAWARNHHTKFGWHIPYFYNGKILKYYPDFVARLSPMAFDVGSVHAVIEVKGISDPQSEVKADYARNVWSPALEYANLGRWEYVYVTDIYKSARQLAYVREHKREVSH